MMVVKHTYISKRDRTSRAAGGSGKVVAIGRALAHVKYIRFRPGEDREPGGRELFDEFEDSLEPDALRKAIREHGDDNVVVHKLVLAPEISPEDKKLFTREVMHKLGSDKGLDLRWVAVEHQNTEHHHIHVVVLGKDFNGKEVRFDKQDYSRIKEYGDRYLERCHPYEFEKALEDRERQEWERRENRQKDRELARQERIAEGIELPWLHGKIIREQLEPYQQWKKEQEKMELAALTGEGTEKAHNQDVIWAAEKAWSKDSSLQELRDLNGFLWDHHDEWIDKDQYRKLVAWIDEKERLQALGIVGTSGMEASSIPDAEQLKDRNSFDWQGEHYSKDDTYERLTGLANSLRLDKTERMPIDQYQQLRGWIESRDRERFDGVIYQQMEQSMEKFERQEVQNVKTGGRFVDPFQQEVMANPVVGIFMTGASLADTVVSWIDLRDNRDRLKEAGDELESAKHDKHADYLKRDDPEDRAWDEDIIDKLDKAVDDNKKARYMRDDERKTKRDDRDKEDPFKYDPWGQY